MATLNDFKIINQKSRKYFDLLLKIQKPQVEIKKDKDKERIGFYLFMLENLTGIKDFSDLLEIITDQDFNTKLFGENHDDFGIDAINIDEDKNTIQLYNFKFKETFSTDKSKINEAINSTKFLNAISAENLSEISGKLKESLKEIIEKLNSNEEWKIQLLIVSNEDFAFDKDEGIKNLQKKYGLEVNDIGLNEISNFISLRPDPINAKIILEKDAVMSFSEDSLSSSKSYIIRLPLYEVIRITSNNKELRANYNIENISELSKTNLDFSVLFDNVRGFVTRSKYNKNILTTLKDEPTKFFIYNNGLTFIVSSIISDPNVNLGKKVKLELQGLQVVNGGQTLRTMHSFNSEDKNNIKSNLTDAQILIRIFNISQDNNLDNKIAEYTNSQNAISVIDLKSLRKEQLDIEQYLADHNILYIRKSGDTGDENKKYEKRISMEKLGQILFALDGKPEKTSNQKKSIFDRYYNALFVDNFKIELVVEKINKYFEIREEYKKVDQKVSDQKVFYILYLNKNIKNKRIEETIEAFENCIGRFETEKELSDARKLIRNDFKVFIDKNFKINHD